MPSILAPVFRSLSLNNQRTSPVMRHLPMINTLTSTFSSYLSSRGQIAKKKTLMRWYKGIPELTALLNKVAIDTVFKWHFETIKPGDINRNKIMKANKFAQQVSLGDTMFSQMLDMLVTGEGYGWMGKITDTQLKEVIKNTIKKEYFLEKKEKEKIAEKIFLETKETEGFMDTSDMDEDLLRPRKYRCVASTTVEVVFDQWDIKEYNHIVGIQNPVVFKPKEMIHYQLMKVDGKPFGFTPVESILVQLELLRQMWQNQLSLHKNGGYPDKVFLLKDMRVNTDDYKNVEQQIQKYKLAENKHGNMVFTGDVDIKELEQLDTMQFKESGLYITGLVAMQWGIPASSIPYIVSGQQKKDDKGGDSERNYWRKIQFNQDKFSNDMNTQLWMPHFGVKIVFDNPFPQNDQVIQSSRQIKLTNLQVENELLGVNEKQLSNKTLMLELGRTDEDLTKKKEDPMMTQFGMNNQLPKNQGSTGQQNSNATKRDEQMSTIQKRGTKPIGKEMDNLSDFEYKEIQGMDSLDIDLRTFTRLYSEDKSYHPGKPPRIFIRRNEEDTTLIYKSSDFVYKTKIATKDVDANRVLLLNLEGNNLYNL